ncbi:MAG: energy transducer TonB [Cyclobacteriaceae bacterium]|nr:energy transducer TonB [Cyclobacteriaceae bacterium]
MHKRMVSSGDFPPPDTDPSFAGGWEAYEAYIKKNIKYPEVARRNGTQGEVQIAFVVRKTGEITDVKVEKSVSAEIDAEATRLISEMPNWIPATVGAKPVSIRLLIPMKFSLP